MLVMKELNLLR